MHTSRILLTFTLLAAGCAAPQEPPEWGGFRGNNGGGVASSNGLPSSLGADTQLWRREVPPGYSSPAVAGSNVFVTAAEDKSLLTMCLERATGKIRWRREIKFDGKRPGANSSASPSPATDGQGVYALFHGFGLVAYDNDGSELWVHPLGPFNLPHGMATSPILHGDLVIVLADQDTDAYLAAIDKHSGDLRWKVARQGVTHSYSTPSVFVPETGPAHIIVSGSLQLSAYSVEDGTRLWWANGSAWQTKAVPVVVDDMCFVNAYMVSTSEFGMPASPAPWAEMLAEHDADNDGKLSRKEWDDESVQMVWFILDLDGDDLLDERDWKYVESSTSATGGLYAVRMGGSGDVTDSHIVWRFDDRRGLPDAPSPLYLNDALFMIKEGGLLTSIDPTTGALLKRDRVGKPDRYYASPVGAAGRIITASSSGQLAVIKGEREWEVLSVENLDEEIWSTPAIADNQVFVRSQEALYCFQAPTPD